MYGSGGKTAGLCAEVQLDSERGGVSGASLCTVLLFTEEGHQPKTKMLEKMLKVERRGEGVKQTPGKGGT